MYWIEAIESKSEIPRDNSRTINPVLDVHDRLFACQLSVIQPSTCRRTLRTRLKLLEKQAGTLALDVIGVNVL